MRTGSSSGLAWGSVLLASVVAAGACAGATSTAGGAEPGEGVPLGSVRIEVSPVHEECMGFVPMVCVDVRDVDGGYEWRVYDSEIQGITLEEGTGYVLDVDIEELDDPPADASSLVYRLDEIVETMPAAEG